MKIPRNIEKDFEWSPDTIDLWKESPLSDKDIFIYMYKSRFPENVFSDIHRDGLNLELMIKSTRKTLEKSKNKHLKIRAKIQRLYLEIHELHCELEHYEGELGSGEYVYNSNILDIDLQVEEVKRYEK